MGNENKSVVVTERLIASDNQEDFIALGTITLETQRLVLRRFELSDAQAVFNNWCQYEEAARYMRWTPHQSVDETISCIKTWVEQYEDKNHYHWIIVKKDTNEPIGTIGLFIANKFDRCGEVGYCLSPAQWGKGYMPEALRAVFDFGFHQVGFNRIQADHSIHNPASGRVMQKAGMTLEGMARQKYCSSRGFEDCNMYGILKEDF